MIRFTTATGTDIILLENNIISIHIHPTASITFHFTNDTAMEVGTQQITIGRNQSFIEVTSETLTALHTRLARL